MDKNLELLRCRSQEITGVYLNKNRIATNPGRVFSVFQNEYLKALFDFSKKILLFLASGT
jgi:hypothetical protein